MVEVVKRERPTEVDVLLDFNKPNNADGKETGGVEVDLDEDPDKVSQEDEFTIVEEETNVDQPEKAPEEVSSETYKEKTYKPKKKKLAHERVKQVLYEKKAMQNAAYSLLEENKVLKRQLESKEKAANAYYKDSTKIRADLAKKLYMEGIEEGDPEKQAEAQKFMIQYETELKDHEKRSKNQNYFNYDEDVYDYVGDVAPPTALDEFLLENEWMDHTSSYYDPDKAELAIDFEKDLLRAMKEEGLLHLKNTKDYFDAISNHVEDQMGGNYGYRYQDQDDEEEYEAPTPQNRSNQQIHRVAPVSRANTAQTYNNTPPKSESKKVYLNEDDRRFALSLDYGTPLSDAEKIRRFASARRSNKQ